jgi:vacuolar-type H+-ATPase subunit I/STV1
LQYLSDNLGWFVGAFVVSMIIIVGTYIMFIVASFSSVKSEKFDVGCGIIIPYILFGLSCLSASMSFLLVVASLIARLYLSRPIL